jgi:hypothetical protein
MNSIVKSIISIPIIAMMAHSSTAKKPNLRAVATDGHSDTQSKMVDNFKDYVSAFEDGDNKEEDTENAEGSEKDAEFEDADGNESEGDDIWSNWNGNGYDHGCTTASHVAPGNDCSKCCNKVCAGTPRGVWKVC